jgi:hypothetical protein
MAGLVFRETADLARRIQGMGAVVTREERRRLSSLLESCESEKVFNYLTDDEKKKVQLWKMMMSLM